MDVWRSCRSWWKFPTQRRITACMYSVGTSSTKDQRANRRLILSVAGLQALAVRGNHEERVIKEWLAVKQGKQDDFVPSYNWMRELEDGDMDYIMQLPYTVSIPHMNCIVVHGGLWPWKPLWQQQPRDMVLMRNIVDVDDLCPYPSQHLDKGLPWASVWSGPEHVYFGHDARRGLQLRPYATGLDTGVLYGKKLTAVFVTGNRAREIISVPAQKCYHTPKAILDKRQE